MDHSIWKSRAVVADKDQKEQEEEEEEEEEGEEEEEEDDDEEEENDEEENADKNEEKSKKPKEEEKEDEEEKKHENNRSQCEIDPNAQNTSTKIEHAFNICPLQTNFKDREKESIDDEPAFSPFEKDISDSEAGPKTPDNKSVKHPGSSSVDKPLLPELSDQEKLDSLTLELEKIEIQWPGDRKVQFNDNDALKRFVEFQYPDWKKPGKTTSVPCVRIPRMMVRNEQLSRKLQKQYRSLQKGEEGENKIYRLFVNNVSTDDCGIMVFPNIDGSHIFEKGEPGSVEIDMIVAHPLKGFFVFNIKNAQKVSLKDLQSNLRKHSDFVRYVLCYNGLSKDSLGQETIVNEVNEIPIHSVICLVSGYYASGGKLEDVTNFFKCQQKQMGRVADRVIVFKKEELNSFALHWKHTVSELDTMIQEKTDEIFDTLVARLVALNSMEGNSSLVHQKFSSNDIQSIQVKNLEPWLKSQHDGILTEATLKEGVLTAASTQWQQDLIRASKTVYSKSNVSNRDKTTVILWTKEQLEIIGTVFKRLTDPFNEHNPLRIDVRGAKGSGKTMLMVHLAQLASCIYQKQQKQRQVVICDGSGRAKVLFSKLPQTLRGPGFEFWNTRSFCGKSRSIAKGIIFIDEDPLLHEQGDDLVSRCIETGAHLCIFSSREALLLDRLQNEFTTLFLSCAMRSTKRLQNFSDHIYRTLTLKHTFTELNGLPSHSLDGTNLPDICFVNYMDHASGNQPLVDECVDTIMRHALSSHGKSNSVAILSFLSPKIQNGILSTLKTKPVALRSISYDLNSNDESKVSLPIVQLESIDAINGSEFQTVVIMLEKMVLCDVLKFAETIRMAVTRATTNLAIVASPDVSFFSSPLAENEISTSLSVL